jgi:hypothetical protein
MAPKPRFCFQASAGICSLLVACSSLEQANLLVT